MSTTSRILLFTLAAYGLFFFLPRQSAAQQMVHPGINQTADDLAFMKEQVLKGVQPWKDAFDRLKTTADTDFVVKPHTYVLRGPYGKPNIGGDDLSKSANMAYNYALVWYVTQDKSYADKAINILNAWSPVLWDFDYNDAKLLAAWTGHLLCNAAEILRYNNAGWQQKDIDGFTNMLMTAYYPLLRYYFPQANGNWDGAIIHSIMAIAIFTDNRPMFNNAVDHFLHGPVNGSVFKYIYPNGQCQESGRDQGHVQLGLGEFAGAAQVAFTQGVDLFSIGNNRIALGYEYTAGFLLGEKPYCYCTISDRAKNLRDDYEYVYRHYAAKGIDLPGIKKAADSIRPKATRSVLTSVRKFTDQKNEKPAILLTYPLHSTVGAGAAVTTVIPGDAITVSPGQAVQAALDKAAGSGKWVVLKAGTHKLPATLQIPANITIAGEGANTILFLDPASGYRDAMINKADDLHDVTIRDLVIEGSDKTDPGTDPNSNRSFKGGYNRGGIIFRASREGAMKGITLLNVTVRNCTFNGLVISGADNVKIERCDFSENGGSVVPGPKLQHNVLLTHCRTISVKNCRLVTSPYGSGLALDHCSGGVIDRCEVARNAYHGILVTESKNMLITNNLVEGNDGNGIMMAFLSKGCDQLNINQNIIHYNGGYGVESYAARSSSIQNNTYAGNGNNSSQEKISNEKIIIME